MQHLKTPKPAPALHGTPVSKSEQLGGRLDPSNSPNAAALQAPDNTGQSDYDFFVARPGAIERLRLPFQTEFAPGVLESGRAAFVRIRVVKRDASTGQPTRVARRLQFCDGGRA
jgi:hypothetical protein